MKVLLPIVLFAVSSLGVAVAAADIVANSLYDGETAERVSLSSLLETVTPGTVVVLSEIHDDAIQHINQVTFLYRLAEAKPDLTISVGMEMFNYPDQAHVDGYVDGDLSDEDFLSRIGWAGGAFELYRTQVLFPKDHGGGTVALNIPRSITSKIASGGLDSLSTLEADFLPPDFSVGNDGYRERFMMRMGSGHVSVDNIEKYFVAQSAWDDTMAWRAKEYMEANPDHVLVVLVGEFHVRYSGGSPTACAPGA